MDPHSITLITTLLLVFAAAIAGGSVARYMKQPALLGYIGAGIIVGNLLSRGLDKAFLAVIADTGVTLLLFTLGVEFSFRRMFAVLGTLAWAASVQVSVTIFLFFLLLVIMGFPFLPSLFIASAISLSSTAVIAKVLSERGELDTLFGELASAWSLIQDLAVVPLMVLLPAVAGLSAGGAVTPSAAFVAVVLALLKAGVILALIVFLGRRGIPKLLSGVAAMGNREIFLLVTIGLVFFAALATYVSGLSAALGAFIAGLLMADTSQHHAVFAEIRPLRDLFAVVFFVSLGMVLPLEFFVRQWQLLIGLTLLIVLVKWLLVMGLGRYLGYHRKTAFLVALSLIPMSEFGFIIASEGVRLRALGFDQYVTLVSLVFLTIFVSTPLVAAGHKLYYGVYHALGGRWPTIFRLGGEELTPQREELALTDHIVICGYGRVGKYIGRALEMAGIPFVVVDYNQTTVSSLKERGVAVVYGDPAERDVLDFAQVDRAKALIIAIPDKHTQEMIIAHAQTLNHRIKIICRTHHEEDQRHLKSLGVATVVQPEFEAAIAIVTRVLGDFGISPDEVSGKVSRLKIEHGLG